MNVGSRGGASFLLGEVPAEALSVVGMEDSDDFGLDVYLCMYVLCFCVQACETAESHLYVCISCASSILNRCVVKYFHLRTLKERNSH